MSCLVINPFNIFDDPKMPFLKEAISPEKVEYYFKRNIPYIPLITNNYRLVQIKVIRYKPQRRCLIEYTFQGENSIILIGKVRAKGTDLNSYSLQKELWHNGFNDNSVDKISVPESIGIISQWQMWVQKKVSGEILTSLLGSDRGINLSQKVAHVAHKLHQTKINPSRRHTIIEELQILHQKLPLVLEYYPHWQTRIQSLLEKCDCLGKNMLKNKLCGIHRDFYPDQIVVDNDRLYLLDLDLYCEGDPSLDIGNFIAHISEYSLRNLGNIDALKDREFAVQKKFIQLTGKENSQSIEAYKILTLVRHIYLSTQFPERRFYTEALLKLCEQRLQQI